MTLQAVVKRLRLIEANAAHADSLAVGGWVGLLAGDIEGCLAREAVKQADGGAMNRLRRCEDVEAVRDVAEGAR